MSNKDTATKNFLCISCPMGCPLQLEHSGDEIIEISGNKCQRGAKYAKQELVDPKRSFSTTVAISKGDNKRLPVKISSPITKELVIEAAKAIHGYSYEAPVSVGDILVKDLLGQEGINVVACKSVKKC